MGTSEGCGKIDIQTQRKLCYMVVQFTADCIHIVCRLLAVKCETWCCLFVGLLRSI